MGLNLRPHDRAAEDIVSNGLVHAPQEKQMLRIGTSVYAGGRNSGLHTMEEIYLASTKFTAM